MKVINLSVFGNKLNGDPHVCLPFLKKGKKKYLKHPL